MFAKLGSHGSIWTSPSTPMDGECLWGDVQFRCHERLYGAVGREVQNHQGAGPSASGIRGGDSAPPRPSIIMANEIDTQWRSEAVNVLDRGWPPKGGSWIDQCEEDHHAGGGRRSAVGKQLRRLTQRHGDGESLSGCRARTTRRLDVETAPRSRLPHNGPYHPTANTKVVDWTD